MPKAPTRVAVSEDELAADIEYDIRSALRSPDPVKGVVNALEDVLNADASGTAIAAALVSVLSGDAESDRAVVKAIAVVADVFAVDLLEDDYLLGAVEDLEASSSDEETAVTAHLLLRALDYGAQSEEWEREQSEWEADYKASDPGFGAQQEMEWE